MEAADRVGQWVALVDGRYPERDAQAWDATGLQVGDPDDPVTAVLVCLDVTPETLAEAGEAGAELVLAHHPLLFRPLARLTPATAPGRLALHAARQRIAVLAAHTNLDAAVPGTSDPVADLLGLAGSVSLQPLAAPPGGDADADDSGGAPRGKGIGLVGELSPPRTLRALAAAIRQGLPAPHLRVAGDLDALVTRVAVCGGAGDALVGAALEAGAQVLVTGDLRHHVALDALTLGLAVVDAGHHATEAAALPRLAAELEAAARRHGLTARVLASGVVTDPWVVPGQGDGAGPAGGGP